MGRRNDLRRGGPSAKTSTLAGVLRRLIVFVMAATAAPVAAAPTCDAGDARASLAAEATHFEYWRWSWVAAYGALTAGQLAVVGAGWNPIGADDRAFRDSRYVGAAESGIGAIAMLLAPHIDAPDADLVVTADPCADAAALAAARARAGKLERTLFWGSHAGNLAVNVAGSLVLAHETSWSTAALAFALGYPIGLLNTYTMPRASWHAMRVAPVPLADHGAALVVSGAF